MQTSTQIGAAPPNERAAGFIAWCQSAPRGRDVLLAVLLALPMPLVMALMPNVALNYTQHDIFIPLDVAWRTLSGQWPHIDYYTPLGPAYAAVHGAAAWLWGMDGRVVIRANLVALPFVLLPGLLLGWSRLGVALLLLLAVFLSVLIMAPTFLDGPERVVAYLANYNRIGGGLCAVLCLWAFLPPRRRSPVLGGAEIAAAAVALLILLTLKVTFFVLALAILAAGCLSVRGFWRQALLAGIGMVAGAVLLELLHPGLFMAYLGDIRRAGSASSQLFRGFYTPQALVANLPLFLVAAGMGAVLAWVAPRQRLVVAAIGGVAAICVLVSTQNFGAFSAPLVVLGMVLAVRLRDAGSAGPLLGMAGVVAVLVAVTPFLLTQVTGTVFAARLPRDKGVVVGGGRSDTLRTVVWMPNPMERAFMPEGFTLEEAERWKAVLTTDVAGTVLNEGMDLLIREGLTGRRIAMLSFSNPFPVAFRAPPPRGVALWWDEGRTFATGKVSPEMVLGDAEVVMVPKLWWSEEDITALFGIVQDRLRQDFVPHETRYWTAWVRRTG